MEAEGPGRALAVFGVGEDSEQVYRSVLRRPGVTVETLSDLLGRPPEQIEEDLRPLLDQRLVAMSGSEIQPEPPQFALGRLLSREMRRLAEAEDSLTVARLEVHSYVAEHLAGQRPGWRPVTIDEVPGADIADVMQTLIETTRGEMLFLRPDQWLVPAGREIDIATARAVRSGRRSRVIYPAGMMETGSATVAERVVAGERVRLLPKVPARMAIFGSEAAVVPEALANSSGNPLLIRQSGIVAACVLLFEQLWAHAVAVPGLGADSEAVEDQRRQLLELLARGAKDEHIARSMGLSLRTVRRRIALLLAELGADSRFQAGAEAVRRGWL